MKKIVVIFSVIVMGIVNLSATNVKDMFVQRSTGDESLFFIFSQSLPGQRENRESPKKLDYDFTYVQKTDSVTMLMTVNLPKSPKKLLISVETGNNTFEKEAEIIFVKPAKSSYSYRLRIMLSFKEFEEMYESSSPFTISLHYDYINKLYDYKFRLSQNKWLDNRKKMMDIIELIKLNTGK
ncbi:MAG: hypothetical protein K2N03_07920 [Muribaculaceae bacterium]|nr:hypothetical protein [Muribaculaceae bacterium]